MRHLAAGILLAAAMLACDAPPPSPPAVESSCKPDAPFELRARLVGDPQAGATCGVVVDFTALADGEASVEVALPEGLTLVRGDTRLAARLRRGEKRELKLDILVPDTQRREIVVYGLVTAPGVRFAGASSIVLNEDGSVPPSKGVEKRNARGEKILEFRVE